MKNIIIEPKSSVENSLLETIQGYKEAYLTLNFINPLLKTLGYNKIDYHGGPYEEGKDIICWGTDELENTILAVAQVKKFKPTARSSGGENFSEVVNQLQQAIEKKVPNVDGLQYLPSIVYFITPFQVDTRALQSRFEKFESLRSQGVKIIDGPLLLKLIGKNLPKLINVIAGKELLLQDITRQNLKNSELLRALNYNSDFDIANFYSDLDFGIGKVTTRFFFSLKFEPKKIQVSCGNREWNTIKESCLFANENFSISMLSSSVASVEKRYQKKITSYQNIVEEIQTLSKKIQSFQANLDTLESEINKEISDINNRYAQHQKTLSYEAKQHFINFTESLSYFSSSKETSETKELAQKERDKLDKKLLIKYNAALKFKELNQLKIIKHANLIEEQRSIRQKIPELSSKQLRLENKLKPPKYVFYIDGSKLSNKLIEKQNWLTLKAKEYNSKELSIKEVRELLNECNYIFNSTEVILQNPYIKKAVGISENQQYGKLVRLSIPMHKIFDTRFNFFILGEAGAGKTTSLQVYTKLKLENSNDSDVFLFLPLSRIINASETLLANSPSKSPLQKLTQSIVAFFSNQGMEMLELDLINSFQDNNVTCLMDGVDEVINTAPWIIDAINQLSEKHPNIQLIVSARMSGSYTDKIPFTSITLLPFTDKQRHKFIEGWFTHKKEDKSKQLIKHLKDIPELSDIVRVPLLATIFCVLAENSVPLPRSETRLYEERLRLLLGQYDIHKQIVRVKSDRKHLELVARKIAFIFHQKGVRYENKYQIIDLITKTIKDIIPATTIPLAVEELIDPCNILVPMSEEGMLGFGHLRYQEFLVATELCNNRGINILPFMSQDWWRGVLILFSQLTDDIEFIINTIVTGGEVSYMHETLTDMLKVRPVSERNNLQKIIDSHRELDDYQEVIDFNSMYSEPYGNY